GQFLAGYMGTRLGPRRNVLIGMALSTLVTLGMGVTLSPAIMAGLVAINGVAQATGWSGNVGTMATWFHKHERGRVMGLWSTNFTIGALTSGWVMAAVLDIYTWESTFFVGAGVLAAVWLQYLLFQRNKPEDVGLAPIDDPVTPQDESKTPEPVEAGPGGLSKTAWKNLLLVGGFYFFAKFIRYAVWSWAPFFLVRNYGLSDGEANLYATLFELMGLPGVFLTGYISDKYFGSRRAGVSLIMLVGLTVASALMIGLRDEGVVVYVLMLGAVGFTLYGPDALLSGAGAIDIGGRRAATYATGIIAGFGALGPVVQELVISRLYDAKGGDLTPVLVLLFASAAAAMLFVVALVVRNRSGKGI
ncbi:MAG: MFS transporter, partial [Myxococcales bacterium]|nr:MFS transporter [Myxococcales bacterium]